MPKVSIVVPIYNVAQYLDKCMESLCGQTLTDIEIIAVNDKSPDNSADILARWAAQDSRVVIVNNPINMKTAATRNAGLDAATGEYVCFVDGDDFLDADFCEKLYNLAKETDADITRGQVRNVYKNGRPDVIGEPINTQDNKYLFFGLIWLGMYQRERLLCAHNIRFHIDFFCFQIQAVYWANKIADCNDAYYNYVHHEGSCDSAIFTLEKWQRLNLGHATFIWNWLGSHEYNPETRKMYHNRIKFLYFYGFNKLRFADVAAASKILAQTMQREYDCGYDTRNLRRLQRKLFRKNRKTTFVQYLCAIWRGDI